MCGQATLARVSIQRLEGKPAVDCGGDAGASYGGLNGMGGGGVQVCRAVCRGGTEDKRRMLLSSAERKTTGEEGLEKAGKKQVCRRREATERLRRRRDTQRFRAVDRRLMWPLSPGTGGERSWIWGGSGNRSMAAMGAPPHWGQNQRSLAVAGEVSCLALWLWCRTEQLKNKQSGQRWVARPAMGPGKPKCRMRTKTFRGGTCQQESDAGIHPVDRGEQLFVRLW